MESGPLHRCRTADSWSHDRRRGPAPCPSRGAVLAGLLCAGVAAFPGLPVRAAAGRPLDEGADAMARAGDVRRECTSPDPATLDSPDRLAAAIAGATVGRIEIRAGDLFDPSLPNQRRLVHGAANALHVATRRSTVLAALPFAPGDVLKDGALAEAERVLRDKRYLRAATVRPVRRCGDVVDLEVRTVDNWTLTPSVSFSSAGGVARYALEVQDLNVLGLGKELTFRRSESGAERETLFAYGDDNVLGGRHRLRVELGDTETGQAYAVSTGLPFYSADSPASWWFDARRVSDGFGLADVVSVPRPTDGTLIQTTAGADGAADLNDATVETLRVDAGAARRVAGGDASIARIGVGGRYERQRTSSTGADAGDLGAIDLGDFDEIYPYVYAQWAHEDWAARTNFHGLGKTEDIDTGLGVRVEAGLLLDALGNDRDALRIDAGITRGWWTSRASLHTLALRQTVYVDGDEDERLVSGARYQYFRWLTERDHVDVNLVADRQRGRSPALDLQLGGEYGLKGYPNGYQRGDTRLLGTAEYRHVTDFTPFELVNFGWGVFAEAGRAWRGADGVDADALADVGAGLLFSPSRSSRNEIVRLDVSFPLVDGPGVDDYLLFAGTQLSFR